MRSKNTFQIRINDRDRLPILLQFLEDYKINRQCYDRTSVNLANCCYVWVNELYKRKDEEKEYYDEAYIDHYRLAMSQCGRDLNDHPEGVVKNYDWPEDEREIRRHIKEGFDELTPHLKQIIREIYED